MLKLAVIYGGMSTEHDVSMVSGKNVIDNLDRKKYEIYPVEITKEGIWKREGKEIKDISTFLKGMDKVFPVLHGLYGEDGTIQGLLEMLKIPYVGCKVLASSVCMDKVYSKIIFEKAKLNQAKYVYIRKFEDQYIYINEDFSEEVLDIQETVNKIMEKIDFPMFVKPSNSGSSVGISKAKNKDELINSIIEASKFDKKILIEENINGREIECAVLGNEEVKASVLGEILPAEAFYSFSAKYQNSDSKTVEAPDLPEELTKKVRELAVKAYKAADCQGLSRVDFFVDDKENKIYINEINTLPGFTEISMYPKLWEKSGLTYTELLDKLIELAY